MTTGIRTRRPNSHLRFLSICLHKSSTIEAPHNSDFQMNPERGQSRCCAKTSVQLMFTRVSGASPLHALVLRYCAHFLTHRLTNMNTRRPVTNEDHGYPAEALNADVRMSQPIGVSDHAQDGKLQ